MCAIILMCKRLHQKIVWWKEKKRLLCRAIIHLFYDFTDLSLFSLYMCVLCVLFHIVGIYINVFPDLLKKNVKENAKKTKKKKKKIVYCINVWCCIYFMHKASVVYIIKNISFYIYVFLAMYKYSMGVCVCVFVWIFLWWWWWSCAWWNIWV